MSEVSEKNKIVRAERAVEDTMLKKFFSEYDYIGYSMDTFRMADSPHDYKDKKERRKLCREVASVSLWELDFFELAGELKKIANKLKRKGYDKVDADFSIDYDEHSLNIIVVRRETDAELAARIARSNQARKNAKKKVDKDMEVLKKLAKKKGYHLQKKG